MNSSATTGTASQLRVELTEDLRQLRMCREQAGVDDFGQVVGLQHRHETVVAACEFAFHTEGQIRLVEPFEVGEFTDPEPLGHPFRIATADVLFTGAGGSKVRWLGWSASLTACQCARLCLMGCSLPKQLIHPVPVYSGETLASPLSIAWRTRSCQDQWLGAR